MTDRPADPRLGDGFANREAWLAGHDAEAAGWLCAGRARREGTTVAYHIAVRERLLALVAATTQAGEALVGLAARHTDTLTLDYTYLQQAQPTTLAHYLCPASPTRSSAGSSASRRATGGRTRARPASAR